MKWLVKLVKVGLFLGLGGAIVGAATLAGIYFYLEPDLPPVDDLRDVQLQVPLKVFSRDGRLIAEFGEKRRSPLTAEEVPETMIQAFLSAEDANFYSHPGVDYRGLLRAGIQLLLTGQKRQGGSTITMQVARNFYLTRKKTFTRKLSEIFLALRIEKELSKSEILELYLNKIYLGHRAYGVGAAAQVYYGREVHELSLAQVAMIAGLPKAPSAFNPIANPPRAVSRRNYVLGRMLELGYIDQAAHDEAAKAPVTARRHAADIEAEAPYIAEMIRADMVERFGQDAYTGGYEVYTTIHSELQDAANAAVRKALDDYSERHGYHGPEGEASAVPPTAEERDELLGDRPLVGELRPALVIAVAEESAEAQSAEVHIAGIGPAQLAWDDIKWARAYQDANTRGPQPKLAAEVLTPGEFVRVRPLNNEDGSVHWRLAQVPRAASALVSLNPVNGAINALVGGYDFYFSKFNRATQAQRQPGSGFKPVIYSAALDQGFTPASMINDAPVVFEDPSLEGAWRPENYSGKFFGPTRLRYALTKSRNLVSIRLLRSIGIRTALAHAEKFGFDRDALPANLSLSLGSANVTPLQMARAYAVLANGGFLVEPFLVERIEQNRQGVIYQADPLVACEPCEEEAARAAAAEPAQAGATAEPATQTTSTEPGATTDDGTELPPQAAPPRLAPRTISRQNRYLMYSMMRDVITSGTARRARSLGRKDLAGKTGTTNDQRDAWFNGFNAGIVTNVWVGFDDNSQLGRGEVGGRAALPAWIDFMKVALREIPDAPPRVPEGLVSVRIDPESGLRAPAGLPGAMFELFPEDNVPEAMPEPVAPLHSGTGETPEPGKDNNGTGSAPAPLELF